MIIADLTHLLAAESIILCTLLPVTTGRFVHRQPQRRVPSATIFQLRVRVIQAGFTGVDAMALFTGIER
ncbi:hypothetical protein E5A73_04830 [Sphingomonas gei]|uniref:Uncharacterized protein n=1 Tax=Sphingomonas gei TaxID=1395960 RepID=A0A4S1XGE0_9SPHN|nr:hypothetical protein [Sphingomonas gei]TGX54783.1 hypothetical protein E5A73_04830 [Sphingomonas gei]